MSLLLLLGGAPAAVVVPTGTSAADAWPRAVKDAQLLLVSPDRTAVWPVIDADQIKLIKGPKLQDTLQVALPRRSLACSQTASGVTALASRFEGWSFDLYVRGILVFSGPRMKMHYSWKGRRRTDATGTLSDPTAQVVIDCESFYTRLTRDRKVYGTGAGTSTGAKFSMTGSTWLAIARTLVRENMVAGSVVEPTDWDTGGLDRATFGPAGIWSVTCPSPSGSGSADFAADFGDNLHDTLDELCDTPASSADQLWPTCTETSPGVWYIDFLVGRSGGSRGVGADRTQILVSPELENLITYDVNDDGAQAGSHWQVAGKGSREGQLRRYKSDSGAIALHGLSEDSLTLPDGTTNAELDNEAQRQINERAAGNVTHVVGLVETPVFRWPTDFDIKDTLTIHTPLGDATTASPSAAEQLQLLIIGVEWTKIGHRPPQLKLVFGRWPTVESRRQGRSGGGGSGGRGGGGRPRGKAGLPINDPDEMKGYAYVLTQNGDVEAEGPNHYLKFAGRDLSAYLRAFFYGTNASSGNGGSPDLIEAELVADYTDTAPEPTGYITVKLADGKKFHAIGAFIDSSWGTP